MGRRIALVIGLPIGLAFSLLVLVASMMGDGLLVAGSGAGVFWLPPISCGLIPGIFARSLWTGGAKAARDVLAGSSWFATSLAFALHVNVRVFGAILAVVAIGALLMAFAVFPESALEVIGTLGAIWTVTVSAAFVVATIVIAFTVGLVVVWLIRLGLAKRGLTPENAQPLRR